MSNQHILLSILTFLSVFGYNKCIYIGQNVRIKHYPYQVSVRVNDQHVCGGAIIDTTTVLTAAHCVLSYNNPYYKYTIRAGSSLHNKGEVYFLSDIIIHQKFNHTANLDLDVAILKLSIGTKFTFGYNIQPIELQTRNLPNAHCKVSGWGETEYEDTSTYLKATEVSIITNEECSIYFADITPNKICARASKCSISNLVSPNMFSGDSGGPLVCNNTLVGLVSGGKNRVYPDYPGVYTKISELYNWIVANNRLNFCFII